MKLNTSEVLADSGNGFASALEMQALKRSSNTETFELIKHAFDEELKKHVEINNENITDVDGMIIRPKLDTSVDKLRNKYRNIKVEWRKITDRTRNGSGLAPKKEPKWFPIINPVFSETNANIDLASSAKDTSFMQDDASEYSDQEAESDSDDTENLDAQDDNDPREESGEANDNRPQCSQQQRGRGRGMGNKQVLAAPHKQRKIANN